MSARLIAAVALAAALVAAAVYLVRPAYSPAPAPSAPTAASPPPVALTEVRILSLQGEVLRREGEAAWVAAREGDLLPLSAAVRAGGDGQATIAIGDRDGPPDPPAPAGSPLDLLATFHLHPGAQVRVVDLRATLTLELVTGRVSADVAGARQLVLRATGSDAEVRARDAELDMVNRGQGVVGVVTRRGQVRLSARGRTVEVGPAQQSMVTPGRPPGDPRSIPTTVFLKVEAPLRRPGEATIMVRGHAAPGAAVTVGGAPVAVAEDGSFRALVPSPRDPARLRVEVEDLAGRRRVEELPAPAAQDTPPHTEPDWRSPAETDWGPP